jgi:hypothetical protein
MSAPELPNLAPCVRQHVLRRAAVERGIFEACCWHHARGWRDGHAAGLRTAHFADEHLGTAWLAFGVYRWRDTAVLFRGLSHAVDEAGRAFLHAAAYRAAGRDYDRGRVLSLAGELIELDAAWRAFALLQQRSMDVLNWKGMTDAIVQQSSNHRKHDARSNEQDAPQQYHGDGVRPCYEPQIQDGGGRGQGGSDVRGLYRLRETGRNAGQVAAQGQAAVRRRTA